MDALGRLVADRGFQDGLQWGLGGGQRLSRCAMNEKVGAEKYMELGESDRIMGGRRGTSAQPGLGGRLGGKRQSLVTVQRSTNTMTLERWEQISRIFYATLEVNEKRRADFLKDACAEDADLLDEVRSLLATDEQGGGLPDQSSEEERAQHPKEEPGSLLGHRLGPYRLVSLLGVGGMGEVYKAVDTRLQRVVALKILPKDLTTEEERVKRFQQEARAISVLNHPHICTLYDIGEHNGRSFLVMEYLAGETLAERLKMGPLPLEQALEVGADVAGALEAAHKQGIVHCDLKPGNVMLTRTGAKLIDFGLAKLRKHDGLDTSTAETVTQTTPGVVMGTLEYMSPEQLEGKTVDRRTDFWGLGVILYEMFTGRRAFEGKSQARVIAAILEHEPVPVGTVWPIMPSAIDRLIRRCLAKSPGDRWDNAHDLATHLRQIRNGRNTISKLGQAARQVGRWKRTTMGLSVVLSVVLQAVAGF